MPLDTSPIEFLEDINLESFIATGKKALVSLLDNFPIPAPDHALCNAVAPRIDLCAKGSLEHESDNA